MKIGFVSLLCNRLLWENTTVYLFILLSRHLDHFVFVVTNSAKMSSFDANRQQSLYGIYLGEELGMCRRYAGLE